MEREVVEEEETTGAAVEAIKEEDVVTITEGEVEIEEAMIKAKEEVEEMDTSSKKVK